MENLAADAAQAVEAWAVAIASVIGAAATAAGIVLSAMKRGRSAVKKALTELKTPENGRD